MTPTDIPKPWTRTPLIESAALSRIAGCRIFLKLENLQPSGSFKSRGLGNLIHQEVLKASATTNGSSDPSAPPPTTPPTLHFLSSSGGNAGLGAVTASRTLGQKCTVVVPLSTKPSMIARIRAAGATDVIQEGASWREADAWLRENLLEKDPCAVYVPPFEHELIYEGNAEIVHETSKDLQSSGDSDSPPDAFVCSVGGGGLFCGLVQGAEEVYGVSSCPRVVAVETKGCDSLNQSVVAGQLITLPAITSMATNLGASRVGERTFKLAQRPHVTSVVVSDAQAAMGCWRYADDHRTLVELSCGASLCLVYNGMLKDLVPNFGPQSKVVIVVCGGNNISLQMIEEYKTMFASEI